MLTLKSSWTLVWTGFYLLLSGCGVRVRAVHNLHALTTASSAASSVASTGALAPDLSAIAPVARTIDSAGDEYPIDIKTDLNGNVLVSGYTSGALTGANAGSRDVYLQKTDSAGSQLWIKQFGGPGNDGGYSIDTDASGDIYLGGAAESAIAGGYVMTGNEANFLAKYDANGNPVYLVQDGGAGYDRINKVMVGTGGAVFTWGYSVGVAGGGGQAAGDCALHKYDSVGALAWSKHFGTAGEAGFYDESYYCLSAARASTGEMYVAFSTTGSYGTGTNQGGMDGVLIKVDSSGNEIWSKMFGTTGTDTIEGVVVDPSGNIFITGSSTGDLAGAGTNANPGTSDRYVAKLSAAGTVAWIKMFGGTGDEGGSGLALSSDGHVYIAGFSTGTLAGIPNAGGYDTFVAVLNSAGTLESVSYRGGNLNDVGKGIALDPNGTRAHVFGYTNTANGSFLGLTPAGIGTFVLRFDF